MEQLTSERRLGRMDLHCVTDSTAILLSLSGYESPSQRLRHGSLDASKISSP